MLRTRIVTLVLAENMSREPEERNCFSRCVWNLAGHAGPGPGALSRPECLLCWLAGTKTQEGAWRENSRVNTQQPDSGRFFLGLLKSLAQVWPESEAFTKSLDPRGVPKIAQTLGLPERHKDSFTGEGDRPLWISSADQSMLMLLLPQIWDLYNPLLSLSLAAEMPALS